jgi:hypothetical protein
MTERRIRSRCLVNSPAKGKGGDKVWRKIGERRCMGIRESRSRQGSLQIWMWYMTRQNNSKGGLL